MSKKNKMAFLGCSPSLFVPTTVKAIELEAAQELTKELKEHIFTKEELALCKQISNYIFVLTSHGNKGLSAKEIGQYFKLGSPAVRKYIQLIRRHNDMFFDSGLFLIAFENGYKVSSDINEIKAFYHKTLERYQNTTPQLAQLELTMKWLDKQ